MKIEKKHPTLINLDLDLVAHEDQEQHANSQAMLNARYSKQKVDINISRPMSRTLDLDYKDLC